MQGGRNLRVGLICGAVVLVAVIYLLPKTPDTARAEQPATAKSSTGFSFEKFRSDSLKVLGWDERNKIENWEKELATDSKLHDSIAKVWDEHGNPGISAWYFEKKANATKAEKDWLSAAYRYFDAYKSGKDSSEVAWFTGKAIENYTRVLELNPANLDAKTDLGILYAEASAEPMKGIMMLRDVVTANPNHENAQVNLGFLSMKSGQFEKATERFKKVLEINPTRIDMYIYIGESYVRMNDKEKAIENFQVFRNLSNDQQMVNDVDTYIATLKEDKK